MPGGDSALIALMLENALLKKKGQAFEDFFIQAGIVLWGADFEPWKPQGRYGDFKCDGYLASEGAVFQCHAPEQFSASTVSSKIEIDFNGARQHFGVHMRKWVFVHNQHAGLPGTAGQTLISLRGVHSNITIEAWSPNHLISKLLDLPADIINKLFPTLATNQDLSKATWDFLDTCIKENHRLTDISDTNPTLNRQPLDDVLDDLNEQDRDIRRRLLGYSRWFDPANKIEINQRLLARGLDVQLVENNARRLHEANLIKITEHHYLPLDEEICQQAAESLMDELVQELEG